MKRGEGGSRTSFGDRCVLLEPSAAGEGVADDCRDSDMIEVEVVLVGTVGVAASAGGFCLSRKAMPNTPTFLAAPISRSNKGVNIGNRLAASRLADELNLITLNILDCEDTKFGEKMKR